MFSLILILNLIFNINIKYIVCLQMPKIAIIGGGIGGSSTVHFLEELFQKDLPNIHLYEANKIGGRLATTFINDDEYEIGGSVIHPRNLYMQYFRNILGMNKRKNLSNILFGFFNPKTNSFSFTESDSQLFTYAKLIWRYGLDPYFLDKQTTKTLDSFERIYSLQEKGGTFTTIGELLNALNSDFPSRLNISSGEFFKNEGYSNPTISELIQATLVVNYGQNNQVHGFVAGVSVAGSQGNLWSLEGGNKKIPENLLKQSQAKIISQKVKKIVKNHNNNGYQLITDSGPASSPLVYDYVIIAAPQATNTKDRIRFENFHNEEKINEFQGEFHRTVCTLVSGKLNQTFFQNDQIGGIFSTDIGGIFNSVSKIEPVYSNQPKNQVFKVFSKDLLTDFELREIFEEVSETFVQDWLAYPEYDHRFRDDSFVLDKGLFYLNAIEWAASAMEMSAIAAKNAALLVYKDVYKDDTQIHQDGFSKFLKEEL